MGFNSRCGGCGHVSSNAESKLTEIVLLAAIVVVDQSVGVAAARQAGGAQAAEEVVLLATAAAGRRAMAVQVAVGRAVEFVMQSTHQLVPILQFG